MGSNPAARVSAPAAGIRVGRGRLLAVAGITAACAVGTMALGQKIWTSPPGAVAPPANLVPFFIALEAAGDVLFGLGVSFVIFGYGLLARARQPLGLTYATYVAIAWLMLSWWPHGNLHRVTADFSQLLYVEYGFHLTLMVAIGVVAVFFLRAIQTRLEA